MNTNWIFFNQSFDKKRLKALIDWVLKTFGEKEALRVVEEFKETGFRNATQAGLSLGIHELTTPPDKAFLISKAQIAMNVTHNDFMGARITATERSQRIVDTWHRVSETLRKQVVDYFSTYDKLNPIYIMALSGARGNFSQVRQLVGMRGLMADPLGKIISFPIRSNLREGLTLTEYFISCSGARKGLVDTALRTADTGYLTRRLVDVSHHIVVKRVACDTHRGILVKKLQSNNKILLSLKDRLIGRVLAEDIKFVKKKDISKIQSTKRNNLTIDLCTTQNNTLTGPFMNNGVLNTQLFQTKVKPSLLFQKKESHIDIDAEGLLAKAKQEIFPDLASEISRVREQVFIRSPLTCAFNHELCQLCYGWSLSQGNLVPLGEAVGVIAAQSIGEPGTQLTMRTFHTGGVFSGDLLQEIRATHSGKIFFSRAIQGLLIRTTHGKIAFLTKTPGEIVVVANSSELATTTISKKRPLTGELREEALLTSKPSGRGQEERGSFRTHLQFQPLSMLFVRQGEHVEKNQLLAEVSDFGDEGNQSMKSQQTIFAELSGKVVEIQGGNFQMKDLDGEEENQENETLHQIEPEKSGKLGLFHLLSTKIGATFNPFMKAQKVMIKQRKKRFLFLNQASAGPRPFLCLAKHKWFIGKRFKSSLFSNSSTHQLNHVFLNSKHLQPKNRANCSTTVDTHLVLKFPLRFPLSFLAERFLDHQKQPAIAIFDRDLPYTKLVLASDRKHRKDMHSNHNKNGKQVIASSILSHQQNCYIPSCQAIDPAGGHPKKKKHLNSKLHKNIQNVLFHPFKSPREILFNQETAWASTAKELVQYKQLLLLRSNKQQPANDKKKNFKLSSQHIYRRLNCNPKNSNSLLYLRTIAEEGDLVNEDYKNYKC